jgi:hypothetical protein
VLAVLIGESAWLASLDLPHDASGQLDPLGQSPEGTAQSVQHMRKAWGLDSAAVRTARADSAVGIECVA